MDAPRRWELVLETQLVFFSYSQNLNDRNGDTSSMRERRKEVQSKIILIGPSPVFTQQLQETKWDAAKDKGVHKDS